MIERAVRMLCVFIIIEYLSAINCVHVSVSVSVRCESGLNSIDMYDEL